MTMNRTAGEKDDVARLISFSSDFESAGAHMVTMQLLSLAEQLSAISSIEPSTDLVDGSIYTAKLAYQDGADHAPAVVEHILVAYAGSETIPPVL